MNLRGFVTPQQDFSQIDRAGEILQRQQYRDEQLAQQKEAKKAATSKYLTDYLDPKDALTGTNYDPEIVKGFNGLLQQGIDLANKGADVNQILMALSPGVGKLNQYSIKAKLIHTSIKDSVGKLKAYKGYNQDALLDEAKKLAFYDENGKLKDINTIDENIDWLTEVVRLYPERVTSGAGLDDFVNRSPLAEESKEIQTMYAGKKRNVKYNAKRPFWEDLAMNEKGEVELDVAGNPVGLDVASTIIKGDDNNPLINPATGKPYRVMDRDRFNAIMKHNPDIADWVRGQVNQSFRDAGADKIPTEGSPQWEMKARNIMYDELKSRSRGSFKTIDKETVSAPVTRIQLGYAPYETKSSGGKSNKDAGANWVDDAVNSMKGNDFAAIENVFSHLYGGDKGEFVGVKQQGDKIVVTYRSKDGLLGELSDKTAELDKSDPYIKDKVKRLYQAIVGGDVNVEREPYYKTRNPSQSEPKQEEPKEEPKKTSWFGKLMQEYMPKPKTKERTKPNSKNDDPLGIF